MNNCMVFAKPWIHLPSSELAKKINELGFCQTEFPLRWAKGIDLDDVFETMHKIAGDFANYGITIPVIGGELNERSFLAAKAVGAEMIRIMLHYENGQSYLACEKKWQEQLNAVHPLCEKYNVKIGIQNHCGTYVNNSMELRHLLEGCDKRYVGAVWDVSHSALAGEEPEQGLDIVWEYLFMVNLKSAYYKRDRGEDGSVRFSPYFTTANDGAAFWGRAVTWLKSKGYAGRYCMHAEYTLEEKVDEFIREDYAYFRSLF